MVNYKQWAPGNRVRDRWGRVYVVASQLGCMVHMVGELDWWHPNNLTEA